MEVLAQNRRQYYRVVLNVDMCASIMILSAYGSIINSNSNYICIKDISGGGLKFRCKLDLPINKEIVYKVDFSIEKVSYSYETNIIRKDIQKDGSFIYGAKFNIEESERDKLITLLNNFAITQKKTANPSYVQCNKKKCPYKIKIKKC